MNSRYDKVIEKYSSELSQEVIDQFAYGDPSGDHKYLDWMCSRVILRCKSNNKKSLFLKPGLQTVEEMVGVVQAFHQQLSKFTTENVESSSKGTWYELSDLLKLKKAPKDIYSYSTYNALEFYVMHISSIMTKKDLRDIVHEETTVHYDNGEWKIVTPLTMRASNYYGRGTKWCTSADENNQFETYRVRGSLFYILGKEKLAYFHSYDEEECDWYNDTDSKIPIEDATIYVPKEILNIVLEKDAEIVAEQSYSKDSRAYFVRILRELCSQSNYMGFDGWRLEHDDNAAVWVNEKEESVRLWLNPTHKDDVSLNWLGVLTDEYFKKMLHVDEWMMWDVEEIYERRYVDIHLDLTGDITKDRGKVIDEFLLVSAKMIECAQVYVDEYIERLSANRILHLQHHQKNIGSSMFDG